MKRRRTIFLCAAAAVCALLLWTGAAERRAHAPPAVPRADIAPLLAKNVRTDADYDILLHQTGLGPAGVQAVLERDGPSGVLRMQQQYFAPASTRCEPGTPLTRQDLLEHAAELVPLEDGDVLVTPAAHFLGWRIGHAALVVDAAQGRVLECSVYGVQTGDAAAFARRAGFAVLRLADVPAAQRARIAAQFSCPEDTPYALTAGLLFPKGDGLSIRRTNCSHLVWSAFAAAGYDLDATGGPVVTPRDLALSPRLEIVQIYGIDPDRRWPALF